MNDDASISTMQGRQPTFVQGAPALNYGEKSESQGEWRDVGGMGRCRGGEWEDVGENGRCRGEWGDAGENVEMSVIMSVLGGLGEWGDVGENGEMSGIMSVLGGLGKRGDVGENGEMSGSITPTERGVGRGSDKWAG